MSRGEKALGGRAPVNGLPSMSAPEVLAVLRGALVGVAEAMADAERFRSKALAALAELLRRPEVNPPRRASLVGAGRRRAGPQTIQGDAALRQVFDPEAQTRRARAEVTRGLPAEASAKAGRADAAKAAPDSRLPEEDGR